MLTSCFALDELLVAEETPPRTGTFNGPLALALAERFPAFQALALELPVKRPDQLQHLPTFCSAACYE